MRSPSKQSWVLGALVLIGLSLAVASIARSGEERPVLETARTDAPPPPDVVLIVLDTLRPDHLGCYGYERDTSPNIDAFAETAVLFEKAESVSPWTAPALISLMTSLHPEVHGVYQFPNPGSLNERVETLAERLGERGYATGAFTEGGYAKAEFGLGQGFDVFPSHAGDEDSNDSNMHHGSRLLDNLDRALAWYASNAGRPRLLFFHTYEVHEPLRAPSEYVRRFRPDWDEEAEDARIQQVFAGFREASAARAPGEPVRFDLSPEEAQLIINHWHHCFLVGDMPQGFQVFLTANDLIPEGGALNPDKLQFFRDQYDAEIRFTDDQLGRLFEAVGDEAIVVLVSDHGEAIGEHQVIGHGSRFHREQLGVVLIVRAPGVEPGRRGELVRSVDVKPTVLELAGVSIDGLPLQGQSLVPLLFGTGGFQARPSVSHGLGRRQEELSLRSMRFEDDLRVIRNTQTGALELYDLGSDPLELVDLASDDPDRARRLGAALERQVEVDREWFDLVSGSTGAVELDPEAMRRLRELGYIDGGDGDE